MLARSWMSSEFCKYTAFDLFFESRLSAACREVLMFNFDSVSYRKVERGFSWLLQKL